MHRERSMGNFIFFKIKVVDSNTQLFLGGFVFFFTFIFLFSVLFIYLFI